MYLDKILEQNNTNSTRHKSKNGECHSELVFNKDSDIMKKGNDAVKKELKQEQFEIDAELQYEEDFKNRDLPLGALGSWEEDKEEYLELFTKRSKAKEYFETLNEGEEISELKTLGEIRREEEKIIEALERKEAVSVGVKENEGKIDYSEINLDILDLMASRFNANKHKYPKGNMKKQIDIKSLEWALFRHLKKMIQPIEGDKENYKDHISAILCNASMILDQINLK